MSAQPNFSLGQRVFLFSGGVATLADVAGRDGHGRPRPLGPDEPPAFWVVRTDEVVACVPVDKTAGTLRPLVGEALAERMLEVLHGPAPEPAPSLTPLLERGKQVVHEGDPLAQAHFVRELLELPVPLSEQVASGLAFIGKLVLGEIAEVLRRDVAELQRALKARYPAASDLTPQGPIRHG